MPTFELDGQTVTYTIRRSRRARRMQMKIGTFTGLEVVLPRRYALYEVPGFLQDNLDWLRKHLAYLQDPTACGPEGALREGQEILLRGQPHRLRLVRQNHGARRPTVVSHDGLLTLHLPPDDHDRGREVLEAWMRQEARRLIEAEIRALSAGKGFAPGRLFVRDQRTCWGSCSRRGNLSFSWRLVMTPPEVLRYVVAHELAHLKEWNHTEQFWQIVAQLTPDHRAARAWLRQHGGRLRIAEAPREP